MILTSGVSMSSASSPIFLAFSGGRESLVLNHILASEPVTLLWVNTGYMFPHMVDWVRGFTSSRELIEVASDQRRQWNAFGLPADIVPVANAMPQGQHHEPQIQAWVSCCSMLRAQPVLDYLVSLAKPVVLVHGQRHVDRAPGLGLSAMLKHLPAGSEVLAPLADWSDADVQSYVDQHQLALPPQYPMLDSLECWNCPAAFNDDRGAARAEFMAKHYPNLLVDTLPLIETIRRAGSAALKRLEQVARVHSNTNAPRQIVPQRTRGVGDCAIASLATVLGNSYEAAADMLGYQLDERGWPVLPTGGGVALPEISLALLRMGFAGTSIIASDHPATRVSPGASRAPSQQDFPGILAGENALLLISDWATDEPILHAVPWLRTDAFDCRDGRRLDISELSIAAALLIRPCYDGDRNVA